MKVHEKKLIGMAILLSLGLVLTAGVYLIYRAWDYWSADQIYADIGRNAVEMVKVQEETKRGAAQRSKNRSDRKDGTCAPAEAGRDSASEAGHMTNPENCRTGIIDGKTIPDKPVIDWEELIKSGKDIVAWLSIPALGIAYPVVQGDDNEFYLHHLPNGDYKNAGSLFMEAANRPDLTDVNTVIYGHNMDNGSMFGKFRTMTEKEYKAQPFLWLCTKEKACLYEMISIHISHVGDESYTLFKLAGSMEVPEHKSSNVIRWICDENLRSYIHMPMPKSALDRMVTLSTCASYSDERRVLQAILVGEFEP